MTFARKVSSVFINCARAATQMRNFTIHRKSVRGIHAFFFIARRTGSLWASAETTGADDLFEIRMDRCICDGNRINYRHPGGVCIFILMDAPASEKRLEQTAGESVAGRCCARSRVDVIGGPIPRKPGYYGEARSQTAVWTWEIPLTFSLAGIAGMSAVIALGSGPVSSCRCCARSHVLAAIAGAVLSPFLLILDLGRPHLFLKCSAYSNIAPPCRWRVDSDSIWGLRGSRVWIALGIARASDFRRHIRSTPELRCRDFHFWRGNLWNFARDLQPASSLEHGDSRVVFCIAHCCRFILELPDWDLPPPCWNCSDIEFPALNFIGFYAAAVETALLIWLSVQQTWRSRSRDPRTRIRLVHSHRRSS